MEMAGPGDEGVSCWVAKAQRSVSTTVKINMQQGPIAERSCIYYHNDVIVKNKMA